MLSYPLSGCGESNVGVFHEDDQKVDRRLWNGASWERAALVHGTV